MLGWWEQLVQVRCVANVPDGWRIGVSIPELLSVNRTTAAVSKSNRPAGKLRQLFNDVSRLPRRQEEHITRWVSAFVRQYEEEQR